MNPKALAHTDCIHENEFKIISFTLHLGKCLRGTISGIVLFDAVVLFDDGFLTSGPLFYGVVEGVFCGTVL